MIPLLWVFVSYLIGSIPSSYIAGRLVRNIDLRQHGSGNLGATNAFRVLGARVAGLVMVADMAKGFVPAALFALWDRSDAWAWALAYGAAAILGHVFSIYMNFRGGKGVATASGVFLALSPVAVSVALCAWLATLFASRMVSLASICGALVLIPTLLVTESRDEVQYLGVSVALFVIFAHRANIGRILRGEEHRFGRSGRSNAGKGESVEE